MTTVEFWEGFESGRAPGFRILRGGAVILGIAAMIFLGTVPLDWPQQAVCGLLLVILSVWLSRASNSYLVTLLLMMVSLFATFRYAWWRIGTTLRFFLDPTSVWKPVDAFFILLLVGAETYAASILFLGFFQTIWPLRRAPLPLPDDPEEWPDVDLLIPTYNEPLSLVRYTALAALNIDWPADKLHVYILDDGKRTEFQEFALEAGLGYLTRDDNLHAKAGNINRALAQTASPYVAIFDSDHVPTRSFLQVTLGWFLRDRNLGMLQTPHHFYSPDPFERNLGQYREVPNEGELFYGVVQDGNDFWNATFFCGSCAVLRRTALDEIGGIAVETVTEDAHTSLRMQINGWNTAYINIAQAAGLATERLSGHVKQRIRWARGMIQILRADNPLFAPGLSLAQRLCYFNAITHFMYALPRLIFLTAPLIYLVFGFTNVPGYWVTILAYALPHLTLSNITNSRIQGRHRHSFWNEVYETVLAPYILLPTVMALLNPRLGKFNVTAKGGVVRKSFFDARIAQPFIVLAGFNLLGLLMVVPRCFHIPHLEFLWDGTHPGTIVMNALWTVFNLVILGTAIAVARESKQLRESVRINVNAPVKVKFGDQMIVGETLDASSGGVALTALENLPLRAGDSVELVFPLRAGDAQFPATVVHCEHKALRVQFDPLTIAQEELLTTVLYSRADSWLGWGESRQADQPLRSLALIFRISLTGLAAGFSIFKPRKRKKATVLVTDRIASLLVCGLLAGSALLGRPEYGRAEQLPVPPPAAASSSPAAVQSDAADAPGTLKTEMRLKDLGVPRAIELRGVDAYHPIYFSLPQNEVVRDASLHVYYHFSPSLLAPMSHIKIILNGTLIATLQAPPSGAAQGLLDQVVTLPADLLVRNNRLAFEFVGHYAMVCEDPANTVLWSRIDAKTSLSLAGDLLPLTDDLKFLPLPFFDSALTQAPVIPISFSAKPSPEALEAAGIVSSYFGVLGDYRTMRFPVSVGAIPAGNVVLFAEDASTLPAGFNLGTPTAPTVAIRSNPSDPYGKVLILTGGTPEQLIEAAQALALGWNGLQGATATVNSLVLPAPRLADDAPRWARTDQTVPLWNYNTAESLQGDGSVPIQSFFRLPPDLYFGTRVNVPLKLEYRYNAISIGPLSSIQVSANNAFLGGVPLVPGHSASKTTRAVLGVPVVDLRPFSNSLSFQLAFQLNKKSGCNDTTPMNMQGAILRSSYLDLRRLPHWASLPNLELFANAGFPFTRFADLSQTQIVLPDRPSSQEIETYITLLGHFGAQTGYPALRVTVADAEALHPGANSDFLIIATGQNSPAIAKLGRALPVLIGHGGLTVQDTDSFFAPLQHAWWKIKTAEGAGSGEIATSGVPDAIFEGIESPFMRNRSIVLIDAGDDSVYDPMLTGFLRMSQSGMISGTVSLLHGSEFQSYRIGANLYHIGLLPWWTAMSLWLVEVPWIIDLAIVAISFILAVALRSWLRSRAWRRLRTVER
jgi:cellulose synthase (UDP-forming)